ERAGMLARQLTVLSGRRLPRPEVLDPNEVVSAIEQMIRMALPGNIELRVERGADVKQAKADRGQLEQVILNLALNAQESMPAGGSLLIRTYNQAVDEGYAREHPAVKPGA